MPNPATNPPFELSNKLTVAITDKRANKKPAFLANRCHKFYGIHFP
jgi:hypothetical protein